MPLPVTGYVAPRLQQLLVDLRNDVRTELGATLQLESSALGAIIDVLGARLDGLAESVQDLYDSFDERYATGTYLDNLCSLVGVTRQEATYTYLTLTLGTGGGVPVIVPSGSVVEDPSGVQWRLIDTATIPPAGTVDATFRTPTTGAYLIAPATIAVPGTSTIKTPVGGWDTVAQTLWSAVGRDREDDEDLRQRRRESLQITGAACTAAIRANVLESPYVTACKVEDNKTDYPRVVGGVTFPPHSILVVVYPSPATAAARNDIASRIWEAAPAGIQTFDATAYGLTSYGVVVTDEGGSSQTVWQSVASSLLSAVAIEITVDETEYGNVPGAGGTGDTALEAAIVAAYADVAAPGTSPTILSVYEAAGGVAGVLDVTALTLGGLPVTAFQAAFTNAGAIAITPTP